MNNSIQETLFGSYNKDAHKSVDQLRTELENIENLMSYDRRPVALANFDKRKKTLLALIGQKQTKEGSPKEPMAKQASTVPKEEPKLKPTDSILKPKISLANRKLEENAKDVKILFTNLIDLNNICE